jgi:hypothetical protein
MLFFSFFAFHFSYCYFDLHFSSFSSFHLPFSLCSVLSEVVFDSKLSRRLFFVLERDPAAKVSEVAERRPVNNAFQAKMRHVTRITGMN